MQCVIVSNHLHDVKWLLFQSLLDNWNTILKIWSIIWIFWKNWFQKNSFRRFKDLFSKFSKTEMKLYGNDKLTRFCMRLVYTMILRICWCWWDNIPSAGCNSLIKYFSTYRHLKYIYRQRAYLCHGLFLLRESLIFWYFQGEISSIKLDKDDVWVIL